MSKIGWYDAQPRDKLAIGEVAGGGIPAPDLTKGQSGGFGLDFVYGGTLLVHDSAGSLIFDEAIVLTENEYETIAVDNSYMSWTPGDEYFTVKQAGWYIVHFEADMSASVPNPIQFRINAGGGTFMFLNVPVFDFAASFGIDRVIYLPSAIPLSVGYFLHTADVPENGYYAQLVVYPLFTLA